MKPRFTHDCDMCVFLGPYKEFDLYAHDGAFEQTVIARHGDDGPQYISGISLAERDFYSDNELSVALRRSVEIGMFKAECNDQ